LHFRDKFCPSVFKSFLVVVMYKMVLKLLANRAKGCLCKYVSKEQPAFVEGRYILDNAFITIEIIHGLKLLDWMIGDINYIVSWTMWSLIVFSMDYEVVFIQVFLLFNVLHDLANYVMISIVCWLWE
jgi:hypothetical protein